MNDSWPQSGGFASFAMHHLELGDNPQIAWTAGTAASTSKSARGTTAR